MTIIKAFICILAIVTIGYLLIKHEKNQDIMPKQSREIPGTIAPNVENVKKDYISFCLMSGANPKVWEFELTDKLTIIGRSIDSFKDEMSIQKDLTFSREHLGVVKDKNGIVRFTALKGQENPIIVLDKANKSRVEAGHFVLNPGTHTIRMGNTVFEIFFRGESIPEVISNSETRVCKNMNERDKHSPNNRSKTRIWGI